MNRVIRLGAWGRAATVAAIVTITVALSVVTELLVNAAPAEWNVYWPWLLGALIVFTVALISLEISRQHRQTRRLRTSLPLPPVNPNFVDRKKLLATLAGGVPRRRGRGSDARQVQVDVLVGLDGIGKTQVAAEHVLRHSAAGLEIIWARGAALVEDFSAAGVLFDDQPSAAPLDNRRAAVAVVRSRLETTPRRWLLVFDDAASWRDIADLVPRCGRGHVVITSNNPTWETPPTVTTYTHKVDRLDIGPATRLLVDRSGDRDYHAARVLAQALGWLPLALVQAAAYVGREESDTTLGTYIDQLRDRAPDLFSMPSPDDYAATVAEVWVPSFRAVSGEAPVAAELLSVLAYLAALEVPLAWLTDDTAQTTLRHRRSLGGGDATRIREAVTGLRRFSLIDYSEPRDTVHVHQLVSQVTRHRDPDPSNHLAAAIDLLRARLDAGEDSALLVGHAVAAVRHAATYQHLTVALRELATDARRRLRAALDRSRAVEMAEAALAASRAVAGPDDPDTLSCATNLAIDYHDAGRHADALELLERVHVTRKRVLGADHPDTLASADALADNYRHEGRYADAVNLHEGVHATRKRVLGADHPDTLNSANNLAIAYSDNGQYADAVNLHERVYATRKRVLGADHADTLSSAHNVAAAYFENGQYADAVNLHERVYATRKRLLGADHPDTLQSAHNLAITYRASGRHADAVNLHERVYATSNRVLGADHPDSLKSAYGLASAYGASSRDAEAVNLHEHVYNTRKRVLGADHPDTLESAYGLAIAYGASGRDADALQLHERAYATRKRVLGADHPYTLQSAYGLAKACLASGRFADALQLCEHVHATRKRVLGADHPDTLRSANTLALAYRAIGR